MPDIDHEEGGWRAKAERNAVNAPVQGTSADIMKLSMGLIYKEFKARGWDYKVLMNITIHDELVFEIPYGLCEEAVDVIDNIMCFKTVKNLGWSVPLKCDVEFGDDWSVPYNLTEMTWNQGGGDWDQRLIGIFPNKYKHYLECGGTPIDGVGQDVADASTDSVSKGIQPPTSTTTYVIQEEKLTPKTAEKLAGVITKCINQGNDELKIVDSKGVDLLGRMIRVSLSEFKIIAGYEGL